MIARERRSIGRPWVSPVRLTVGGHSFWRETGNLSPWWMTRLEAAKHAWIYGFVVGAAHMSEERLARVNADTVDAWMDTYCARHPRASIGYAAAVLVDELSRMRNTLADGMTDRHRRPARFTHGRHGDSAVGSPEGSKVQSPC